ncbi:uncharacterized protein LOC135818301 [Sycon ciliatum]|uniref:uncharacterized protein LOC135818301 n=1 Tax=Sycon ciliatum TaxID=27933 RepID=UPI0020AACF72
MKVAFAFAVAIACCAVRGSPIEKTGHYIRVEGVNAVCQSANLHHGGTMDVDKLKALCDANEACLGFHSNGMLKKDTSIGCQSNDLNEDAALYLKRSESAEGTQLPVVPLPTSATMGTTAVTVVSDFVFATKTTSEAVRQFMATVSAEYWSLIITHRSDNNKTTTGLTGMNIIVDSTDMSLGMTTDESYQLSIPSSGAVTLTAATVFGARHGLETFSQLVHFDAESATYVIANTPIEVEDKPRFPHRGILLDTARHYHSLPVVKRFIRSLGHAKLNVFHWHIVDNQAFPLQLHTLPNLVKGAFSPQEIYTPEDVADIVAYAKLHGVRVIPEFDTPGHANSWCAGYPEICPSPTCTIPLNPATNRTFDVIGKLISECKGLFTDDYFHLGGDEVYTTCWSKSDSIRKWMAQKNFSIDDTYKYFIAVTHAMARRLGRKSIHWEEVFNHFGGSLDRDTIFQAWLSHETAAKIVAKGYQCILSNQDAWYLDHLKITWQQFYTNDPYMNITDPKQQQLMMGGEACMWSETVDDSDLFNTVWPRAAGAAERLWSPASVVSTDAFKPRLEGFRCLLNRRGIGAAAVDNKMPRSAPLKPGSCFYQ